MWGVGGQEKPSHSLGFFPASFCASSCPQGSPPTTPGSTASTAEMSPGTLPIPSSSWEAAQSAGMSQAWGLPRKPVKAHTASRGRIVGERVSLDLGQLLTCRVDSARFIHGAHGWEWGSLSWAVECFWGL